MSRIVIFGAGDIARLAGRYFETDTEHRVVGYTVDREYLRSDSFCGLPLVAFEEVVECYPPAEHAMFVALGYTRMNRARAAKVGAARALGYGPASYVSRRCSYLSEYPVGDNCLVLEDNTIQAGVRIGHDVTLWSGNHIGHDAEIADHCFVSSHVVLSGWVKVGSYSFIGVNATVANGVTIAPRTLVGAGAVITADTREGSVYVPARSVRLEKTSDEVDL